MSLRGASPEQLERVAALVADALQQASIRWSYSEKPLDHDVAQVVVDDSADDDRGVFESWTLSVQENSAMCARIAEGDVSEQALLDAGGRFQAALDRIQAVLHQAGIEAVDAENDFDPYMLQIVSAPGIE